MAIPLTSAAAAYANAARQGSGPGMAAPTSGPSFGELMKQAAVDAVDTMHQGERMTAAGVVGKADLTDVVNAVSNAEVTLQAVTAVRDKVITAYQEIMRMPM
ncbi:flagellar hook-basal body complex protein FliE [Azospirillum sp. B4]|uniref:flagellar hook-basal body complex protein FliE n=1 Tax=Azospirillum sp. B4 TaxID=95605 RepID=UPI000346834C|nr:flagellar hook-basal body complex protein FliE [Azospirillum sp. B4]